MIKNFGEIQCSLPVIGLVSFVYTGSTGNGNRTLFGRYEKLLVSVSHVTDVAS